MNRIDTIVKTINEKFLDSSFIEVPQEEFISIEQQFGEIPSDIKMLYLKLGYGSIGRGQFSIHCFLKPTDIYDAETARQLDGILIVGDDFAGTCYAYDAKNNWIFGCIDYGGEFEPLLPMYSDFLDFLEKYFLD